MPEEEFQEGWLRAQLDQLFLNWRDANQPVNDDDHDHSDEIKAPRHVVVLYLWALECGVQSGANATAEQQQQQQALVYGYMQNVMQWGLQLMSQQEEEVATGAVTSAASLSVDLLVMAHGMYEGVTRATSGVPNIVHAPLIGLSRVFRTAAAIISTNAASGTMMSSSSIVRSRKWAWRCNVMST